MHLDSVYTNQADRDKYLFYPLYDTIKAIAQTYANLNRFVIEGKSTSTSNSDYQLGYNIPRGSVSVTAGGQILRENIDYEINYDLGTLKSSTRPLSVQACRCKCNMKTMPRLAYNKKIISG